MLSVIMLSVVSVVMLSVVMLNVVMLSVVMLSVVAPKKFYSISHRTVNNLQTSNDPILGWVPE